MLVSFVDGGGWEAEEAKGSWCFAAVTKALRGSLAGDSRSQEEIAHDFCTSLVPAGGGEAAYGGSRGKDIDKYLTAIHQQHSDDRIPHSFVQSWVSEGTLPDPFPLLRKVWGEVDYTGLTTEWIKADMEDETLQQVAGTIERGGLVVVGTSMHSMIIYGYDVPDDAPEEFQAYEFAVWDPTNASTKVVPLGEYDGSQLVLVSP